jgi:Zn-dependent protease
MSELTLVQTIAVWTLPVLFAITLHEAAHGYVAQRFGDNTAAAQGRLTLNPLKHIDPIGTVLVPAVLLALGGFLFGWAKPVPVNFRNLRNPRRDMAIVAAAGPAANLLMAIGWGLLLKLAMSMGGNGGAMQFLGYTAMAGISINLVLMVLNMLPLPPLDGGRVAVGLLPMNAAVGLSRVEPYGFVILLALLFTGVLSKILTPPLAFSQHLLFLLLGIDAG